MEVGENMCSIEKLGYTVANREQYCTTCVIFDKIGQCTYLKQCEANAKTETFIDVDKTDSDELTLNDIS